VKDYQGLSMLFIPTVTKSLLSDGMTGTAGMLGAIPLMATYRATYGLGSRKLKNGARSGTAKTKETVINTSTRIKERATKLNNERRMNKLRNRAKRPKIRRNIKK